MLDRALCAHCAAHAYARDRPDCLLPLPFALPESKWARHDNLYCYRLIKPQAGASTQRRKTILTTFALTLIGIGLGLYVTSVVGAIIAHRTQPAAAGPFEWWQWFWEELKTPIANLTNPGPWYKKTVSLGTIFILIGVFLIIVGAIPDGSTGNGTPPTTNQPQTTTSAP